MPEPLREGAACLHETNPFLAILEGGNRNQLALIEPYQSRINHVFPQHNDGRGEPLPGEASDFPEGEAQ